MRRPPHPPTRNPGVATGIRPKTAKPDRHGRAPDPGIPAPGNGFVRKRQNSRSRQVRLFFDADPPRRRGEAFVRKRQNPGRPAANRPADVGSSCPSRRKPPPAAPSARAFRQPCVGQSALVRPVRRVDGVRQVADRVGDHGGQPRSSPSLMASPNEPMRSGRCGPRSAIQTRRISTGAGWAIRPNRRTPWRIAPSCAVPERAAATRRRCRRPSPPCPSAPSRAASAPPTPPARTPPRPPRPAPCAP